MVPYDGARAAAAAADSPARTLPPSPLLLLLLTAATHSRPKRAMPGIWCKEPTTNEVGDARAVRIIRQGEDEAHGGGECRAASAVAQAATPRSACHMLGKPTLQ